jgi:hypothetical protein
MVWAVILFIGITLSNAFAVEFSALSVTNVAGTTRTSKMYFKDKKHRMEVQGQSGYNILREDKKVMWIVMPDEKTYIEMPFDPYEKPQVEEKYVGEISRKEVGEEIIDGHPTKKYEITYKIDDKTDRVYQWIATDMDFPIKSTAIDGSWVAEFKDIKIGPQPDSLFEIPAGYQKMTMPSFPGMGEGMMPPRGR